MFKLSLLGAQMPPAEFDLGVSRYRRRMTDGPGMLPQHPRCRGRAACRAALAVHAGRLRPVAAAVPTHSGPGQMNGAMTFRTSSYPVTTGNCGNSSMTFCGGRNRMPLSASMSMLVSL